MIKLFMVLYTATGIGAVWGPLSYDRAECERRAAQLQEGIAKKLTNAYRNGFRDNPVIDRAKDWEFRCEVHEQPPVVTDP